MRVSWSKAAAFAAADAVTWAVAESEAITMFAGDSVPAGAVYSTIGLKTVELPCGLEVDFEEIDGARVHIQWAQKNPLL